MRRMLVALLAVLAMIASMIGLAVGFAAPASAVETITVTPSPYLDAAAPLDVTINGFPTMVLNNYYVYFLDFNNMTGSNTGNVCPTFALVGGAGTPTPNGSPGANVANPTLPACAWVSGTRFRFVYSDATGLNATSQVKITFPANTVAPPASGQYNVLFTAGALGQYSLDSICIGNCPTGYVPPVAPAVITIDIDGNGGTCSTTKVTGYQGTWAKAPEDGVCTKDGSYLTSYNTSADGSGLVVPVGGNLNLTGDNRIYAIWGDPSVGAPIDVRAAWNGGVHGELITWKPPTSTGGRVITGYRASTANGSGTCIAPANELQCNILADSVADLEVQFPDGRPFHTNDDYYRSLYLQRSGLLGGSTYGFSVQALFGPVRGAKGWTAYFDPNLPTATPGAPTGVVAKAGWDKVTVSWTPPADLEPKPGMNYNAPITNYLVIAKPSFAVCVTRLTSPNMNECTFDSLRLGRDYTFRVQALNNGGWGTPSAASNAAAPYEVRVTGSDRRKLGIFQLFKSEVSVKGTAPGYAAGSRIHSWYQVGSKGDWVEGASATVDKAGAFTWSRKFERKLNSSAISVRFSMEPPGSPWIKKAAYLGAGMDFSNLVVVKPV